MSILQSIYKDTGPSSFRCWSHSRRHVTARCRLCPSSHWSHPKFLWQVVLVTGWLVRQAQSRSLCNFTVFSLISFHLSLIMLFQTYEFILAPNGKTVPEDLSPSLIKLGIQNDGFIIHNITGIRTQIVQRLDGQGYDIRRCKFFYSDVFRSFLW